MRALRLSLAIAFGCSACLLFVDTTGLSGAALSDAEPDMQVEAGDDGAVPDADVDVTDGGSVYAKAVLADAPVLYLRLGETTGNIAADELHAHAGAPSTDVIVGQPSLVKGETDTAMAFSNDAYILVPPFDGILAGTKPYSIEAWILVPTAISDSTWILGRDDVDPPRYGTSFVLTNEEVAIERWENGGARRAVLGTLQIGKPTYVVATYDGTVLQQWVDGVSSVPAAATSTAVPDLGAAIAIGSQSEHTKGFFRGTIDEVAIYDRVLPPERIAAHYQIGKP